MILVNQSLRHYSRQIELEHHRRAARQACINFLWMLAGLFLGIGIGVLLRS